MKNNVIQNISLCMALVLVHASQCSAQTDFFYSLSELNGGATNETANGQFTTGETGSLFVYYTTNGPADSNLDTGAFLDIETSTSGVIEFTAAETFNFEVDFGPPPPYKTTRWRPNGFGPAQSVEPDFIENLSAFSGALDTGILEENTGPLPLDLGYDAKADAFLFGRIDFRVIGTSGSTTGLSTSSGSGGIVNNGSIVPATFGSATISVVDSIPEPSALCLMFPLLLASASRRTKSTPVDSWGNKKVRLS